jgi:chromosome partitioning protein
MQTIVFAARKGGCSKTTLAAHLAVEAELREAGPVTLIDTDPQKSLTYWWNDRSSERPALLDLSKERLRDELQAARSTSGYVIIDTPPLDSFTIATVVESADLVVIPVKPSPHDLRGVSVTVDLVRKSGKPFVFVVAQAIQRASLTQQAPLVLSQFGPVATAIMFYRVDYAGAMTDGRTVQEVDPKGKAAAEVTALWSYVSQHLSMSVELARV